MTARDIDERSAAFDLAQRLRDPQFRAYMVRNGYVSGTTVVVAYDDEPVAEVFSRIVSEAQPPVIVAVHRPSAKPYGFVFMQIGQVDYDASPAAPDDDPNIGDSASIGMLYDTMDTQTRPKTHLTIPNDWRPARFKVQLAGAAF
ncbi:hypothetical protein [Micromonospora sp. C81]|uniref:hypothetical protein n=1 Tax=Micromonospora sp. C81 TaxID=2824881 RepID=UPI001B37C494|nr:hypothetical protein [Micromonospora sp. C81]MBQ1035874.1 hypothetical protein [Micromonospora sp. C81]